ncbi:MAG TPA: hypothetical protein VJ755_02490 [Gemmatimonadales bacterium]|nr:hypothetical protein [Gemmatimonadales bacterium]
MFRRLGVAVTAIVLAACGDDASSPRPPRDPNTAPHASIDRFSAGAGELFVRTAGNGLPAANAPVDFDQGPFITHGFGPNGERVSYYNFDVQPVAPAPIFVLFRQGENTPVDSQLNIVDVIPGDQGYNDFWQVVRVTVPADYVANTATSLEDLVAAGYPMQETDDLVNCPIVPEGSTADLRGSGESAALIRGWYKDQVVFYFSFVERALTATAQGQVPLSPIYVSFNINPDQPGGGAPSGFKTEPASEQTHNVVATLPSNAAYSPLWTVNVYDNAAFDVVSNLTTAQAAPLLATGAGLVNCPVVKIE